MGSLVSFLGQLVDTQEANHVSGDILVRAKDKLDSFNVNLVELHKQFARRHRWFRIPLNFLLSLTIYENLKEVADAVELLHTHLKACNLGFRSIKMQNGLTEKMDELKEKMQPLVVSSSHPQSSSFEFD